MPRESVILDLKRIHEQLNGTSQYASKSEFLSLVEKVEALVKAVDDLGGGRNGTG